MDHTKNNDAVDRYTIFIRLFRCSSSPAYEGILNGSYAIGVLEGKYVLITIKRKLLIIVSSIRAR